MTQLALAATLAANPVPHPGYPATWWGPVPESERASWEVLPQDAAPGEVIISKRTELGAFSNLAAVGFVLDDTHYNSLEGLWQMLKYPETNDAQDPRLASHEWKHSRVEVSQMSMWEAKDAGTAANAILKKLGITWVSYLGERFNPRDGTNGSNTHYDLILRATRAKIQQNPELVNLLTRTRGLKLRMDHTIEATEPPAYQTPAILMKIRDELP